MMNSKRLTLVMLDVLKTLRYLILICMLTDMSLPPAEGPSASLWQGLVLVKAQLSFPANAPIFFGDNEPNNCETLVQSAESDQATVVLFGGTTKSKALSWQDNTVTDCYTDSVGYISLINFTALYDTIIFPGKPGDMVEQVGWIGFPQQYSGSSKDINYFTAFVTTTQHQVAVGIQLINMTVVAARVFPAKETRLYDNNMVHYLRADTTDFAYHHFAWGIQNSQYPNQFVIAETCYCYAADYYTKAAEFQSAYGITAIDYFATYLYIGGSAYISGGTDLFGPVFGYGVRWVFESKRLQKIGDLSSNNNLAIDRIFLTRKDSGTGENFAFFLARYRANDGQLTLLQKSNFLVVQCFDHQGGTFGNGDDCVIRDIKLFNDDQFITIDSMFMIPNGVTHDIGFIFFAGLNYGTYSNRTGQADETKIIVAKVQNFHSLHMNAGQLEQNQPLQRSAYFTYPLCKWGRLAKVVMTAVDSEDALLVCSSTDYDTTSLNGGNSAVVIEKLDPARTTNSITLSALNTDVLTTASSTFTSITDQFLTNSTLESVSNPFYTLNLIKSESIVGQTYTKFMNQSLFGQTGNLNYYIKYSTHGTGYFYYNWQPTATLVHADIVSPIPSAYNENLPFNYTDVNMTGYLDLILTFDTTVTKTWTFYILVKNAFQQFVVPNTYIFEVVSCTASSATVTSVPDTQYFVVQSNTFSSNYENLNFTTFTFSSSQSGCGFQKFVLTASSSSYLYMPTTYPIDQLSETTANVLTINKALDAIFTAQVTGYATNNNIFATLNVTVKVEGPCRYSNPQIPATVTFGPIKYLLGTPLQQIDVHSAFINHVTNNNSICYIDRNHLFLDPTPGTDYTGYFVSTQIYLSGSATTIQYLNVDSSVVSDFNLLMRARPRALDRWVDMPFRVVICEITSITAAGPKRIVEQYDPSPPLGLPDDVRYFSEDYPTLLAYFTTVPSSPHTECTDYQLKLTTDAVSDIQYFGTGIELDVSSNLKVDRTQLGAAGQLFLQAKFLAYNGQSVDAHMLIDYEVCSQNAITISSPTATIEKQIKKHSTTQPLVDVLIIPDSDLLAIFGTSCSLCPLTYFKVLTQSDTDYSNPDLQYDGPNGGLAVKTDLAMRRQVKLQAIADPTTQVDFAFIQPVDIPIDISVCGDETITLTQAGPLQLSLEPNYDADVSYTYNELLAMISISNYCRVDTIELSLIGTTTPTTSGAPWVHFIFLDSNNDLKINFNGNIPSNTTYNISIWFTTTGGIEQIKQLDLDFYLRNKPPSLVPPTLTAQTFTVVQEQQLLNQISNFEFISQAASDPEGDVIDFKLSNNLPCGCASISVYSTYHFNLTIDVYQLSAADSGTTTLTVIAKDDASLTVSSYSLDITLIWVPYDNPAPYLESPVEDIILIVNKNNVIENGIYSRMFTSEVLDDDLDPNDIIAMQYVIQQQFDCGCVEMMLLANHSIRVDIYMPTLTEKDAGLHQVDLDLYDSATAHIQSYQFYIDVRFVDIPLFNATKDEFDRNETKPIQELEFEEEQVEEEVVVEAADEEEEEEDDIQIYRPVVKPFRNPFALSKKAVRKIFDGYKPPAVFLADGEQPPEVKLSIVSISRNALLTIKPNQPCYRPSFLDPLNTTRRNLISYDQIDVGRDLIDFSFILNSEEEQRDIQFTLALKDWQEESLQVQVNFTDPLIISKGLSLDQVLCRVRRRDLFVSKMTGKIIPPENKYFADRVPQQLPFGVTEEDLKNDAVTTTSSVKAMVFFQLIVQICLKGSLNELWTLFFTLQIICYLDYYDVPIPANAEIYLEEVTKLIEFDVLNPEGIIKLFHPDFNLKQFMLQGQISFLSANEPNSVIDDLKVFIFVMILAPIVGGIMLVLTVFKGLRVKIKGLLVGMYHSFMFNGLIRSFIIAYIQICLSAGSQIRLLLKGDDQVTFTSIFSAFCMKFMAWVSIVFLAKLLLHYQHRLNEPQIKKRIFILYAGIRTKNGVYSLMYYPIFLFRRVIFILLPTIWCMYPFFQVQLLIFLTSLYVAWYSGERPHSDHKRHKLEVFNEVMIMVVNYHVISFSKFNLDPPTQFFMGYSFILTVLFVILVNISSLVYKMAQRGVYRISLKRFREQIQKQQLWLKQQYYIEHHIKLLEAQLEEENSKVTSNEEPAHHRSEIKKILKNQPTADSLQEAGEGKAVEVKSRVARVARGRSVSTKDSTNSLRVEQPGKKLRPIKKLSCQMIKDPEQSLEVIEEDRQETFEDYNCSPLFAKRLVNQINLNSSNVEATPMETSNINIQPFSVDRVCLQPHIIQIDQSDDELNNDQPAPFIRKQRNIRKESSQSVTDQKPEPAFVKQRNIRERTSTELPDTGFSRQRNIKKTPAEKETELPPNIFEDARPPMEEPKELTTCNQQLNVNSQGE